MRIIPARAGFTLGRDGLHIDVEDHPRSRGVYVNRAFPLTNHDGSSPLARGLQGGLLVRLYGRGIIPARAGFTGRMRP